MLDNFTGLSAVLYIVIVSCMGPHIILMDKSLNGGLVRRFKEAVVPMGSAGVFGGVWGLWTFAVNNFQAKRHNL